MVQTKCTNCSTNATTYCVDCKKALCRFCTTLLHHPDTKSEQHSIEEILVAPSGVKIITPILLDLMLLGVGYFMFTGSGITEDYFKGVSYCPALSRGRWWVANFDANLFFYYKASMSKYCDWEDSYWRFFMDTWVRSILTNTDSWLLIVSEVFKAFVFEEFVRVLITPVIGVVYSIVATLCRLLEVQLGKVVSSQQQESHWLEHVEKFVVKLSFAQRLKIKDKKPPPPPTLRRKRPMTDYVEFGRYMYDRHTRLISHYRAQAQAACKIVLQGTLRVATMVRVFCMIFGGQWLLDIARVLGLGQLTARHQTWFTAATGIQPEQRLSYVSDWLVVLGWRQALRVVPEAADLVEDLGKGLAEGVYNVLWPLLARLFFPALVILPPPLLFLLKVRRQRKQFAANWKKQTRKEIWGDMSRENPCGGWEEVKFSSR